MSAGAVLCETDSLPSERSACVLVVWACHVFLSLCECVSLFKLQSDPTKQTLRIHCIWHRLVYSQQVWRLRKPCAASATEHGIGLVAAEGAGEPGGDG